MLRAVASALLLLAAAGCGPKKPAGPVVVSVIGPSLEAKAPDPGRGALSAPEAVLALATAQGLLRFDAAGQVVPGLAQRWSVSDDGRSLLFRLPDGSRGPDAGAIARRLRAAAAPGGRNPLKPLLGAITEVTAVTPQVIDVELRAPRPNLLQLFAQPPLAIPGGIAGPFRIVGRTGDAVRLRQLQPPPDDPDDPPPPPATVVLRGERASVAVARFRAGRAALVLGGTFNDLAVARTAAAGPPDLRFDPAPGLFGLAFSGAVQGFAAAPENRAVLASVIDRDRIAQLLSVPGWSPATALVPAGTPEIEAPATPAWAGQPLDERRAAARGRVQGWRAGGGALPALRVAMPAGPGGRLLFAAIRADWQAIGIDAVAVPPDAPADLALLDEVAPTDSAAFYLRRFACDRGVPCSEAGDTVLIAARETNSLAERTVLLTQADALIAATVPFIPLGTPVRWSLVAPTLDLFHESPRALHPLDKLRTAKRR